MITTWPPSRPSVSTFMNLGTDTANVQISHLEFSQEDAERGKYAHFMLKEIFEQPRTVENALRGRVDNEGATARFGGLNLTAAELRSIDRIVIAASGTSWHAALVGEYLIEELAHIPGRGRVRARILLPQRAARNETPCCSSSRSPAKRPTRWPRCAKPSGAGTARWPSSTSSAAPSRANPTAAFTCTPARKSASPPPRPSSPRSRFFRCWPCIWAGCGMLSARRALEILHALEAVPKQTRIHPRAKQRVQEAREEIREGRRFLFPQPRLHVPDRAGRRAQAEGNFLHPRRGLFRGGNEARPDCVD